MLFDLHNDFPTRFFNADYCSYIPKNSSKVTAVIWTSEFADDAVCKVNGIAERLSAIKDISIAVEDVGFLADGEKFREFDFSRYLYCSLTWNYNTAFAGGALDDGRLTELGKTAIRVIEDSGCYIDLAHLNKTSFYDVLDCVKNVLCSHTGFNGHPRSLDGQQINALVARKAVIGLCTVRAFTDAYSAQEFANVIDAFVQKYGCDCLALGTDFNGSDDIPDDINDYDKLLKVQDILYRRGYDSQSLNKIFFDNANILYKKER
ncbi:MAG: membrane dipeptidase [Clostridiales bacterium]|nr:membrane dipeptidase [Clostridiales bacterium]